jgi:hypothetical protein
VEKLRTDVARSAVLTLMAAVLCAGTALLGPRHLGASERDACFAALAPALIRVALVLGLTALYALTQRSRALTRATVVIAAGWCLAALVLGRAATAVAPIYSGIGLVQALPAVPAEVPVYSVATYDQTLPFYWKRTVTLVQYRGELDFGLRLNPAAELTLAQFTERWQGSGLAYAIMDRGTFQTLGASGVPMRELAHNVRRVLVARR